MDTQVPVGPASGVSISYCFLSTYPPTQCGLASFTAALLNALTSPGSDDRASVVRVVDAEIPTAAPEVTAHFWTRAANGHIAAASALNSHDVAIIQHEYGIFGGPDGDGVLAVTERLRVPLIAVLHCVPRSPMPHQRLILEQLAAKADAVVVLTEVARTHLRNAYNVDPGKVTVIPHGAPPNRPADPPTGQQPTVLTWGLLGPGKGIEWALAGLRDIRRMQSTPRYVIAGETHPRVRARQGEAYRIGLASRARAFGISELVRFKRGYFDNASLARLISRADVVLLPYDSPDQVSSGVLVEAVAAGKPVVATAFPHAVELLADGAGLVVPRRDGPAIGAALRRIITEPELAGQLAARAAKLVPVLHWPAVADRYRALARELIQTRSAVSH